GAPPARGAFPRRTAPPVARGARPRRVRSCRRTIAAFRAGVQPRRARDRSFEDQRFRCYTRAVEPTREEGAPRAPSRGFARLFERAREPLRHPLSRVAWERALFLAVAAVIGIYAGIAAGLFSQSIRFAQILLFRGDEVAAASFGPRRAVWAVAFRSQLARAHWHVEFAVAAALALAFAAAAEALAARKPSLSRFEMHRIRAVAFAGALGLALYYPLVFLTTFNGTFHETAGGLYAIAVQSPVCVRVLAPGFGALSAGLIVRYV